ncbi:MAG: hypothetical protein K2Y01_09430 [Rhabdochlamydiaceae bacterium]|nr:hypothetical protein [Rhabdochlamydiaceae bacterium]
MIKPVFSVDYQIPYAGIGVAVATVSLSYLVFRCLTASKQEEPMQMKVEEPKKQYDKILVICPKSSNPPDIAFARRVAQAVRKIFPESAKVLIQSVGTGDQEELFHSMRESPLDGIDVADQSIDLYVLSSEDAKKMHVLHDSVVGIESAPSFPRDHIVDIGKEFAVSSTVSSSVSAHRNSKISGIFCLEERGISGKFKNFCLRNYNSTRPQRALYVGNPGRSPFLEWSALLFFAGSALCAQKNQQFDLFFPGERFLSLEVLAGFVSDLLQMVSQHPQKPGKVQIILPTSQADQLKEDRNFCDSFACPPNFSDKGQGLTLLNFSVDSSSDKTLRVLFPGFLSVSDMEKLHWHVQSQLRDVWSFDENLDLSFSEWLSCEPVFLNNLIEIAKEYRLNKIEKFLQDYRRDFPAEFSYEKCQQFARDWMDTALQKEAEELRKIIKKEHNADQWMQQELAPLLNESK